MSSQHSLRILSYNIHKGFSTDRRFVLSSIKQAIKATGAQLVFLQEVIGENIKHSENVKEWPISTQLEFLADDVWPHWAYGKNAVYTEGHHGNAILSQRPFRMYENIDISNSKRERRGLLHGVVEPLFPGHPELHVLCVHLDLFEKGRFLQTESIVKRIHRHVPDECPFIIAGDFNDWRGRISAVLQKELGVQEIFRTLQGKHARTFPAWRPMLPLDRIYVRGLKEVSAQCFAGPPWDKLSDHCALLAVVET